MEGDSLSLWLQKHLKPLSKGIGGLSPETLSWASLFASLVAGGLLYSAYEKPWLALIVVPVLAVRLALDSLERIALEGSEGSDYSRLISRLCDRLADVALLLGPTFWPDVRPHLAMLAIICMLMVSYVGECGRNCKVRDHSGGLLCQTHRVVLLMVFCIMHAVRPAATLAGFSTFEIMFALFIPLSSLTLLHRLDVFNSEPVNRDDNDKN